MKTGFGIQTVLAKMMILGINKSAALLFALLILISLPPCNPVAEGKGTEVHLLHTNNVTGHLFPCPS